MLVSLLFLASGEPQSLVEARVLGPEQHEDPSVLQSLS